MGEGRGIVYRMEVPEEMDKDDESGCRPVRCGSGKGCGDQPGCLLLAVEGGEVA